MWENENLGSGKGGMSSGRDIICRACQEETQNWKGKIKGQKLKYFLWQWLCLEFFTVCAVTLLPTASFKWCEKLRSWSVFLKETDCSNNAQLKTFYFVVFQQNITFYFYISIFSLGSPKNFDFHYHHHNTAKSCSPFLSAGQLRHEDVVRASCSHRGQLQDDEGNPRSLTHRAMKR